VLLFCVPGEDACSAIVWLRLLLLLLHLLLLLLSVLPNKACC
jgi:hypothetical protein